MIFIELKDKFCPIIRGICKRNKCAAYYKETVYWTEGNPPTEEDACMILKKYE